MDYGFAPCERISKEGVQIQIRRKDKCCLNRFLTPDYTMSHEN